MGHRRSTAALAKDHALVVHVQVANQRPVMDIEGVEGPAVTVPGHGNEGRLQPSGLKARVVGAEAVDHSLQLGREAIVVQRGREDDHVGSG